MRYFITAYDGSDASAPSRRQAVREAHLDGMRVMKEKGQVISGGALLNDEGGMIGSGLIVEFENKADLDHWLENDPYVTGGVWRDIRVHPFKQAV